MLRTAAPGRTRRRRRGNMSSRCGPGAHGGGGARCMGIDNFRPIGRYAGCRGPGPRWRTDMNRIRWVGMIVGMVALAGCGSEDDGTAPSIANLTFSPASAPVGEMTIIGGMFDFEDPDGDLFEL